MDPLVCHSHVQTCFFGVFFVCFLSQSLRSNWQLVSLIRRLSPSMAAQQSLFCQNLQNTHTQSHTLLSVLHSVAELHRASDTTWFQAQQPGTWPAKGGQKNLLPRRRDRGGIFRFKSFDSTSHRNPSAPVTRIAPPPPP